MASTITVKIENDPYVAMEEEEMLEKLKRSREHCEEGRCREADKVIFDLRCSAQRLFSCAASKNNTGI